MENEQICFSCKNKKTLDDFIEDLIINCFQQQKTIFRHMEDGVKNNFTSQLFRACAYEYCHIKLPDNQEIFPIEVMKFSFRGGVIYFDATSDDKYDILLRLWEKENTGNVKEFVAYVRRQQNNQPEIFVHIENKWTARESSITKNIDTVFLPKNMKENLMEDIKKFVDGADKYKKYGLKYQRGYLFYGSPGSGKTSTIKAICNYLNLSVYVFNFSRIESSKQFIELTQNINQNKFHALIFEDIDCVDLKRQDEKNEDEKNNKITLDIVLNFLDGIEESTNRLVFMTTNHVEKLDPALIRDGRIDKKIEFGLCDEYQFKCIYEMIIGETLPQIKFKPNTFTTSQVINLCLQNKNVLETVQ